MWFMFCWFCLFVGLVDKILSARFWIPLSRLTYCAYLVHPIALLAFVGSFETVRAYSDVHIVSSSCLSPLMVLISCLLDYFVSLLCKTVR